jgi:hypothetical protein
MLQTNTQLGVGRDDSRWSPGFVIPSGTVLYGGEVVTQLTTDLTGKTLQVFSGAITSTMPFPIGLVWENTTAFGPGGASGDSAAGVGFDSLDYARGNEYSVFHDPGNVIDVLDDQRNTTQVVQTLNGGGTVTQNASAPFITTDSFAIGNVLYATVAGLLTITPPGSGTIVALGVVRATSGTPGTDQQVITVEWAPYVPQ